MSLIPIHGNTEGLTKLIDSVVALGDVDIPSDLQGSLHILGEALGRVLKNRQILTRIHARVLTNSKMWAAEVRGREAEYRIKLDDLMTNDPTVRAASSLEAKQSRARQECRVDHRAVVEAQKEKAAWDALLEVCEQTRENLKIAKEAVSRLCNIAEMQVTSAGLGLGAPRTRSY